MLYPEISKLMEGFDSRYSLVIATAKRARQLALNNAADDKPVSRAINEIAAGKVKPRKAPVITEEASPVEIIADDITDDDEYAFTADSDDSDDSL